MDILRVIADVIKAEMAIGERNGEPRSESIRNAALAVHMDYPKVTSGQFGDAAVLSGVTQQRQSAMNRWNECKENFKDEW